MAEPLINLTATDGGSIQVPGYAVVRQIGQGRTASVYLAEQESTGRRVALKIFNSFDDSGQGLRLLVEGRILASLNHPNIIPIYEVGMLGDQQFIVMEYLEGGTLAERVAAGIEPGAVLDMVQGIGSGLDFAHRRGIIHGDVESTNIMLSAEGAAKLTDFGIATQVHGERELTGDGSVLLSHDKISPKQDESRAPDGRSDVYALGLVLYQALTGSEPAAEESPTETALVHRELPAVFAPYQELLERMLSKDPERRFESAGEMVGFLKATRLLAGPRACNVKADLRGVVQWQQVAGWLKQRASERDVAIAAVLTLVLLVGGFWSQSDTEQVIADPSDSPALAIESTANHPHGEPPRPDASDPERINAELDEPIESPPDTGDFVRETYPPVAALETNESKPPPLADAGLFRASAIPEGIAPAGDEPALLVESLLLVDVIASSDADANADLPGKSDEEAAPPGAESPVVRWLAAADKAMREYRLTTPAQNSAVYFYRKVLEKQPTHPVATQGIVAIAKIYSALAQRALKAERVANAEQYVARGLSLQPQNTRLIALAKDIEAHKRQAELAARSTVPADPHRPPASAVPTKPLSSIRSVGGHPSILDLVE